MSIVEASSVTRDDLEGRLEQHRSELTGYCYRMLGSPFEAEDAVQETLLRAWRGFDRFEGREVLRWQAAEVAELLETSVASVNSALQRARATLATTDVDAVEPDKTVDDELLARYVQAFEAYDIDALTSLIQEDAKQSMPPFDM